MKRPSAPEPSSGLLCCGGSSLITPRFRGTGAAQERTTEPARLHQDDYAYVGEQLAVSYGFRPRRREDIASDPGGIIDSVPPSRSDQNDPVFPGPHYLVTFRPLRDELVSCGIYSQFIDFPARNPNWEIRRASEVDYGWLRKMVQRAGRIPKPPLRDLAGLTRLMTRGGAAVISKEVMRRYLPSLLRPVECVRDLAAFVPTFDPPDDLIGRTVPTRRQRGNVLHRDGRRCTICGRSPRHHVDLELDLHHVLPVRKHGPTVEENLLTLCGTCHAGLHDDHDPTLREHGRLAGPLYDATTMPLPGTIVDNLIDGIIVDRQQVSPSRCDQPMSLPAD